MTDKLNVNLEHIKILTERDKKAKLKLKKANMRGQVISGALLLTSLSIVAASVSPDLLKDRHNIYEGQNLTIDKNEVGNIISSLEKELDKPINPSLVDSYLLLDAVDKNDNLTEDEKQCFYDLANLIEDNPYINKEKAYENLLNLDMLYVKNRKEVDGTWEGKSSKIKIDNNLNEGREKIVAYHEIIHSLFEYYNNCSYEKPQFILEGMCELLTLEYGNKTDYSIGSYVEYVTFVKMLCEVVGSDVVLKSYSTGDMSYIYNAMADIKGTPNEAKDLIENIDKILQKVAKDKLDSTDEKELNNAIRTIRKLDDYYEEKTNKKELIEKAHRKGEETGDYEELISLVEKFDERHDFYYYNKNFLDLLILNQYENTLFAKGIYAHKAYFSKELKSKYENPYIELKSNNYNETIEVNKSK